jgi:hypothetical protein
LSAPPLFELVSSERCAEGSPTVKSPLALVSVRASGLSVPPAVVTGNMITVAPETGAPAGLTSCPRARAGAVGYSGTVDQELWMAAAPADGLVAGGAASALPPVSASAAMPTTAARIVKLLILAS